MTALANHTCILAHCQSDGQNWYKSIISQCLQTFRILCKYPNWVSKVYCILFLGLLGLKEYNCKKRISQNKIIKWDMVKVLTIASFDGMCRIRLNLVFQLTYIFFFFHSWYIWRSNVKWLSITTPSKLTSCLWWIVLPWISIENSVVWFLAKIMVWKQ